MRTVEDADLDAFFEHQQDPAASTMAAVPTREREAFAAHWAKIRADDSVVLRTILADGQVAAAQPQSATTDDVGERTFVLET